MMNIQNLQPTMRVRNVARYSLIIFSILLLTTSCETLDYFLSDSSSSYDSEHHCCCCHGKESKHSCHQH